uniref:EGF-like domain-containing protein n=1 Tax=Palpitomonas bilix TaxID=652834 RepID=A0A7S3D333_9EUKA
MCPTGSTPVFPDACVCSGGLVVVVGENKGKVPYIESCSDTSNSAAFNTYKYLPRYEVNGEYIYVGIGETINPFTNQRVLVKNGVFSLFDRQWIDTSNIFAEEFRYINVGGMEVTGSFSSSVSSLNENYFFTADSDEMAMIQLSIDISAHASGDTVNALTHVCANRGAIERDDTDGSYNCKCVAGFSGFQCQEKMNQIEYINSLLLVDVSPVPSVSIPSQWRDDSRGGTVSFSDGNPCRRGPVTYTWLGRERKMVSSNVTQTEIIGKAICAQVGLSLLAAFATDLAAGDSALLTCPPDSVSLGECSVKIAGIDVSDIIALDVQCACPSAQLYEGQAYGRTSHLRHPSPEDERYLGRGEVSLSSDGLVVAASSTASEKEILLWERDDISHSFMDVVPERLSFTTMGGVTMSSDGLVLATQFDTAGVAVWSRERRDVKFSDTSPQYVSGRCGWSISADGLVIVGGDSNSARAEEGGVSVSERVSGSSSFTSSLSLSAPPAPESLQSTGMSGCKSTPRISGDALTIVSGSVTYGHLIIWERNSKSTSFDHSTPCTLIDPYGRTSMGLYQVFISDDGLAVAATSRAADNAEYILVWIRPSRDSSLDSVTPVMLNGAPKAAQVSLTASGYLLVGANYFSHEIHVWRSWRTVEDLIGTAPDVIISSNWESNVVVSVSAETSTLAWGRPYALSPLDIFTSGAVLVFEYDVSCPAGFYGRYCRPCPSSCPSSSSCDDGYEGTGSCL